MPVVPLGEQQVQDAPLPGAQITARVSPTAEGADIGNALSESGVQLSDAIRLAQRHSRQIALQNVSTAGGNFSYDQLNDPDHGLLNKHGAQVFDDQGQVKPEFNKVFDDFAAFKAKQLEGISDPIAKERASNELDNRAKTMHYAIGQHIVQERTRYDGQMTDALVKTSQQNAEANASDPALVGMELDKQRGAIRDYGERNGTPKAAIDQQVATQVSATHLAVIQQLAASGMDQAASAYYDANKGEIVGQSSIQAANLVKAGSLAGQAQRETDGIVLDKNGELDTRANIDERIRKIQDPLLRDEVQKRSDQRLDQHQREVSEQDRSTFMDAADHMQKSADGIHDPYVVAAMAKLPPERVQQLQAMASREIPAFSKEYVELNAMVGKPEFLDKDLTAYRGLVPDNTLVKFSDLQREQREKGPTGPKVADAETDNRIVANALYDLGLNKDGKQDSDAANVFRSRYDTMKAAWMAGNGGKPLNENDKLAIQKALISDHAVTVARGWYNVNRWFGDATTTEKEKLFTQDVDTIRSNIPGLPIPGTATKNGVTFSHEDLTNWVDRLSGPSVGDADRAKLQRWAQGLTPDGAYDPALITRYQMIRQAAKDEKARRAAP